MAIIRKITKQKNGQNVLTVPSQIAESMRTNENERSIEVIIEPMGANSFIVRRK